GDRPELCRAAMLDMTIETARRGDLHVRMRRVGVTDDALRVGNAAPRIVTGSAVLSDRLSVWIARARMRRRDAARHEDDLVLAFHDLADDAEREDQQQRDDGELRQPRAP